jgi:hypothetical protein
MVTVTDATGLGSTATAPVSVTENPDKAPVVSAPANISGTENQTLSFTVSASDPDGEAIAALTADLSGLPAGNNATFVPASGNTSGTFTWTPSYSHSGTWMVVFRASNARTGSASTSIAIANVDRLPTLAAPVRAGGKEGSSINFTVTASDPDGQAISSLTADLSALPAGNSSTFVTASGNGSGTFSWTPGYRDSGSYTVTFRAANTLAVIASTQLAVANTDRAPVVTAPSTAKSHSSSTVSFTVTASDPDGDPINSLAIDLSNLTGATFTVNATKTSGTFNWTPHVSQGDYTATFIGANALSGSARTLIQVRRPASATAQPLSSPQPDAAVPTVLALSNGVPNPVSSSVTFTLELPNQSPVKWAIYDIAGREIWSESRVLEAGECALSWDGSTRRGGRAVTGVYLARVHVAGQAFTRRLVRL